MRFDPRFVLLLVQRGRVLKLTLLQKKENFQDHGRLASKVETPIHDNIRGLVTWECKEHGVKIMNVLTNPKGSVGC